MYVAARARLVLARRPWLYWLIVAAIATLAALVVRQHTTALDESRRQWGATVTVLVASADLEPGDPIAAEPVELPRALVSDRALTDLPDGARLRQRVATGEVLTELDVATSAGPAALAADGTVVVALSDPLGRSVAIGLHVQVAADGIVLAPSATVVDLADDVVYVAVDRTDGPAVAAASQQGIASLLFLP